MSLRGRIITLVALLPLLAAAGIGFAADRATQAAVFDQLDDRLYGSRRDQAAGQLPGGRPGGGAGGAGGAPSLNRSNAADRSGRALAVLRVDRNGGVRLISAAGFDDDPLPPPRIEPSHLDERPHTVEATSGDGRYRVLAGPENGGERTVWALSLDVADRSRQEVTLTIALTGAGFALLGGVVAWFLLHQDLRRLAAVFRAATAFGRGDLNARAPVDGRGEVARMAAEMNTMLSTTAQAMGDADSSRRRLAEFIDDVGHEIRTPITTIGGYVELYQQGALPDAGAVDRMVERIGSENRRIGVLVSELSMLARTDRSRETDLVRVDLRAVLADAVEDALALDPERPITLDAPTPAPVLGDRVHLEQMAANLMKNIRVHTPSATPARIELRHVGTTIVARFIDEGPGIPDDLRGRIFQRSVRAPGSGGRGLGLSIVARIVENHGGSVMVEPPATGRTGTVVRVTLPVAPPAPATGPSADGAGHRSNDSGI